MQESIEFQGSDSVLNEVKGEQKSKQIVLEFPDGMSQNIVVVSTLDNLMKNLKHIPMDKLNEFVNKYAV